MSTDESAGSRQVELAGPLAGAFLAVIALFLVAIGPFVVLFGESRVGGLCAGIVTVPMGILLALNTFEWRRTARRFQAVGVRATAEVLAVNEIREGGEEQSTASLTVRISGRGFDMFDSECTIPIGRVPQVGDRRAVVVDPVDGVFAIGYDHLFPERDPQPD